MILKYEKDIDRLVYAVHHKEKNNDKIDVLQQIKSKRPIKGYFQVNELTGAIIGYRIFCENEIIDKIIQ